MDERHKSDTREFLSLTFAEQAKSITASIDSLQELIEHHIEHSPQPQETIKICLGQLDRLLARLDGIYEQAEAFSRSHSRSREGVPIVQELPRVHLRSPRLADPKRAGDFIMEVAEEPADAGVR
jgi:hypothetical protein